MRLLVSAVVFCLAFLVTGPVVAQDSGRALEAYNRGDYTTALREWTPLADQGNADAQFNLGRIYENGRGVAQDYTAAVTWYRRAAEQGHERAQFNLGSMYHFSPGVTQDYAAAATWYRKSAEQGHEGAQLMLGSMYNKGWGVRQDDMLALMWFELAASQGSSLAFESRDVIAARLSRAAVDEAKRLARECRAQDFRECRQ